MQPFSIIICVPHTIFELLSLGYINFFEKQKMVVMLYCFKFKIFF